MVYINISVKKDMKTFVKKTNLENFPKLFIGHHQLHIKCLVIKILSLSLKLINANLLSPDNIFFVAPQWTKRCNK